MSQFKNEKITLDNVVDGRASVYFDRALKEVIDNIYDEATDEKASRGINLNFTITPVIDNASSNRKDKIIGLQFNMSSKSSLCKSKSFSHKTYIDFDDEGRPIPVKYDPVQADIFEKMSNQFVSLGVKNVGI